MGGRCVGRGEQLGCRIPFGPEWPAGKYQWRGRVWRGRSRLGNCLKGNEDEIEIV